MHNCGYSAQNHSTRLDNDEKQLHGVTFFEYFNQDPVDCGGGVHIKYTVKITRLYLCGLVFSIVFHVVDIGTDTYLAYQYLRYNETKYFLLTVSFVIIPTFISTVLSVRMYANDKETAPLRKWILRGFGLTFQFAPVVRYFETLQYALKMRNISKLDSAEYNKYSELLLMEDSNLALLRIIEGFLEAAPQQVLQIAILLRLENNHHNYLLRIYQYMSICTSLVSIAWSFAVYNRSIRFARQNKRKMNWTGSIVQVSWFFFVTSSRILAISVAASVFPVITFVVCAAHWFLMTTWISICDRPWFCRRSEADSFSKIKNSMEFIFCAILGLVYIFAFLPTKDGDTRYKYFFYYSIYFIENTAALVLWSVCGNPQLKTLWWFLPLLVVTFCMFLLGVILMFVYYWYFHPERGVIPKFHQTQEPETQNSSELKCDDNSCTTKMVQTDERHKCS